jgi:hypothetical protein
MATFDLTSSDTTGVFSNSIAALPSTKNTNVMRNIEAYLDIDKLVAAGGSFSDGDVFQVLEIPANHLILNAGAEVMAAFTGSAASTYTQFITATDTIDCTIAGAAPATGRLRVYATVIDLSGHGLDDAPVDVDRDQLA